MTSLADVSKSLKKSKFYFLSPTPFRGFKPATQSPLAMKPNGLWFACGNAWVEFLTDNDYEYDKYKYLYEVTIDRANAKILSIKSLKALERFMAKYQYVHGDKTYINWFRLQHAGYDGLIICPWLMDEIWTQYPERINEFFWYAIWDVASGLIWNPKAFKTTRLRYSKRRNGLWQPSSST